MGNDGSVLGNGRFKTGKKGLRNKRSSKMRVKKERALNEQLKAQRAAEEREAEYTDEWRNFQEERR